MFTFQSSTFKKIKLSKHKKEDLTTDKRLVSGI